MGAAGIVFSARDVRTGVFSAIKILNPELMGSARAVARFDREAKNLGRLMGNNVVRIYEVGATQNGLRYIAMELLDGVTLQALLRDKKQLPWETAVDYAIQASTGLAEAHALGIVHRDMKPANLVLVGPKQSQLKILDFGISKELDDLEENVTHTNVTVGTPFYMSPEQLTRPRDLDTRTDIWSLGIVIYEMVAGRHPFSEYMANVPRAILDSQPMPLSSVVRSVPPELDRIVSMCLAKDPDKRMHSALMLKERLEEILPRKDAFATTGDTIVGAVSSPDDATQIMAEGGPEANTLTAGALTAGQAPNDVQTLPDLSMAGKPESEEATTLFHRDDPEAPPAMDADLVEAGRQYSPSADTVSMVSPMHRGGQEFPPTLASFSPPGSPFPMFDPPPPQVVSIARERSIPIPPGFKPSSPDVQKEKFYRFRSTLDGFRTTFDGREGFAGKQIVIMLFAAVLGVAVGFTLIRALFD